MVGFGKKLNVENGFSSDMMHVALSNLVVKSSFTYMMEEL